jgi:hypothetical protein
VRTASFTPDVPFRADAQHTIILNPEHHLGLTDLAGNPSITIFNREIMFFNDLGFTPR